MVKRVDLAVYNAYADAKDDKFTGGVKRSASRKTASAAIDDNNKALITPEMLAAVDKAKADIIAAPSRFTTTHRTTLARSDPRLKLGVWHCSWFFLKAAIHVRCWFRHTRLPE
jgi:basic membrane lipoprotein Med (substrate-binding protein (PBP1-ABC) superfamily)